MTNPSREALLQTARDEIRMYVEQEAEPPPHLLASWADRIDDALAAHDPGGRVEGESLWLEAARHVLSPNMTTLLRNEARRLAAHAAKEAGGVQGEFEVWQDDMCVAGTSGLRERALGEAMHYAHQYVEDGPVIVQEITRTEVCRLAAHKQEDNGHD